MKKSAVFAFALVCALTAAKAKAETYDKADPEVCAKVAAGIKAGDADALAIAPSLQDEGICSAKQLDL
jgi:hypothetical protein